jgi:hypothetical protein
MVPEAPLEENGAGLAPTREGWFVLNARDARWRDRPGRGLATPFEGEYELPQVGVRLYVLGPGEPMGMYHWEAGQEDFLVVSGKVSCSSRARSARCGSGISSIARRGRST